MAELVGRTVRLFLALWPPPPIVHGLVDLQSRWRWPEAARLVAPGRLHVTLHFLGAVPAVRVSDLRQALEVPFEPHAIALDEGQCRVWPGGIAVLELQPPPALLRLHEALGNALRLVDWPVEDRAFRPHVTFARRAAGARTPPTPMPQLQWTTDAGYALVASTSQGYETLQTYR